MTGPATPGHRGQEAALRSAELLGFGGPQAWLLGMAGLPEGLAGLGHALGSTPESFFSWFPVFEMYFLGCTLSSLAAFGKLFFFFFLLIIGMGDPGKPSYLRNSLLKRVKLP